MPAKTCPTTKQGRCTPKGKPRSMVHVCTRFPGHAVAWHRCTCGHTWTTTPTTNHTPTTQRRSARRRHWKEKP